MNTGIAWNNKNLSKHLKHLESFGFKISFNHLGHEVYYKNVLLFRHPEYRDSQDKPQNRSEKYMYDQALVDSIRLCHRHLENNLLACKS